MQLKRNENGNWTVWLACKAVGEVRKVPQNPAYGRGSGPISSETMVWGAFMADGRRIGMDFRTRKDAAEKVATSYQILHWAKETVGYVPS